METYRIEEKLPCAVTELRRERTRLPFRDAGEPVGPTGDMRLLPAVRGGLLVTKSGLHLVEDSSLVRRLGNGGVSPGELQPEALAELEELHAAGLVEAAAEDGSVTVFDVPGEYTELYDDPAGCTWFTMAPEKLELDLTLKCNQRCIHCGRESSSQIDTSGEMEAKRLFELVAEAGLAGVLSISLMGGEPTLHPHFIDLAYYVRYSGIPWLSVSTNATTIDDRLAELMTVLFTSIQVSLHGATARTHDAIVGLEGAFEKACRGVKRLTARDGCHVGVACTVLEANSDELEEMVGLAAELGADDLRFINLAEDGRGKKLPALSTEEKSRLGRAVDERSRCNAVPVSHKIVFDNTPPDGVASFYGCSAGRNMLYIKADGRALACSFLEEVVGDLSEESLLEVWHSPGLRRLRLRQECDCSYTPYCMGGCLVGKC